MDKFELLKADTIGCMVWDIIQSLKADAEMLEDKFEKTDEYCYCQDARDLKMLVKQLERTTSQICCIIQEYRP